MPEIDYSFLSALSPRDLSQPFTIGRLWQLTNTRYLLGMKVFVDSLNAEIDPANQSFRVHSAFDFVPREPTGSGVENITTVLRPEGQFAVFEFGAALPRAKLFNRWQIMTNEAQALETLASPGFDPRKTVLLAAPVPASSENSDRNANEGDATITSYEPKRVVLTATPPSPAVLLLNDKIDPNWKVTVNGQPQPLLRCNYIMRGVFLSSGTHTVEFYFDPPHGALYISLATIAAGISLGLFLWLRAGPSTSQEPTGYRK